MSADSDAIQQEEIIIEDDAEKVRAKPQNILVTEIWR
jgi:hypothetical protein